MDKHTSDQTEKPTSSPTEKPTSTQLSDQFNLPYYNSTSFPLAVKENLLKLKFTDEDEKVLKYHQFITKEFFIKNRAQRGLLIAHAMGFGKTRLAVSIASAYRDIDPRRKIIIMLPKSLEANFKNTIKTYSSALSDTHKQEVTDEYIDKNYKFISLNASNMFKQVSNIGKHEEEIEYERRLGEFMDDIIRKNSLDNSLLIIDEAHNLFNSITNGSKNAVGLYDMIMTSKNLKLIFLTGTPIINDAFELIPCFNMLRGPISTSLDKKIGGNPDDEQDDRRKLDDDELDDRRKLDDEQDDRRKDRYKSKPKKSYTGERKHKKQHDTTYLFSEDVDEFE